MAAQDILLGALSPPLAEQIPLLSREEAKRLDAHKNAINRLRIHGLMTRDEARRAERRLIQIIRATLKEGGA